MMATLGFIPSILSLLALHQALAAETCSTSVNATEKSSNYTLEASGAETKRCIIVQLSAHFKIGSDKYVSFSDGKVDGNYSSCPYGRNRANIRINFDCGHLWFNLSRESEISPLEVSDINGELFVGSHQIEFNRHLDNWKAYHTDHSYACESEQSFATDREFNGEPVQLILTRLIVETFRNETHASLYQTQDHCLDDTLGARTLLLVVIGLLLAILCGVAVYWYRRATDRA